MSTELTKFVCPEEIDEARTGQPGLEQSRLARLPRSKQKRQLTLDYVLELSRRACLICT